MYLITYLCLGIVHAENEIVCSIPMNQTLFQWCFSDNSLKYKLHRLLMMLDFFEIKSVRFMQQMDRLHPLIDKKWASLRRSYFFIQIDSSHFFVAITSYIANVYKISKKIQLHFPEAWLLYFWTKWPQPTRLKNKIF